MTVNLLGQVFRNHPYFTGYKNESVVFYDPNSWSLFTLKCHDRQLISQYPSEIFVTYVSDFVQVLYNFKKREYTIIFENDTLKVGNDYLSIAIDDNEKILYATMPSNHEEYPLEIKKVYLKTGTIEYTGIRGYVHRIVGDYLFFYIETSSDADSPYDIYRVGKNKLEQPERIFENQTLNLDFEISVDGQMIFARNYMERVVLNLQTGRKQLIREVPMYNYAELPPVFSFDGKYLIFYQTNPFEIKKLRID